MKRFITVLMVLVSMSGFAQATSYLLSDNGQTDVAKWGGYYDNSLPAIHTGATYTYSTDRGYLGAGGPTGELWGLGGAYSFDPGTIAANQGGDPDHKYLQDGQGYGGYQEVQVGWGDLSVCTSVIYDLKNVYSIDNVDVRSMGFYGPHTAQNATDNWYSGMRYIEVWGNATSGDPTAPGWVDLGYKAGYADSLKGGDIWHGTADQPAGAPNLFSGNGIDARYIQVFVVRAQYQFLLGEVAVFGNQVPEPATIGLLSLGIVGLLRKRNK
jgi:hypothetical protein